MIRNFITKLWLYLTNPKKVKYALCLIRSGYLHDRGWFDSFINKKVIDKNHLPYPWLTYPAIDFLKSYLTKQSSIFEYGSGYSTLFYCRHYRYVASVEHNRDWYHKIKSQLSTFSNYEIYLSEDKTVFINTIEKTNKFFDCIVIDGKWRNECLIKAIDYLNPGGMLVLDNAERLDYKNSIDFVINKGFFAIPFIGMSALSYEDHNTLIFFKR